MTLLQRLPFFLASEVSVETLAPPRSSSPGPSRSPSMPAVTGFRTLHKWSLPALETSHPLQTVSSSAIELFYWTTRRDYFSQCFRKDLGKFSTFSIGLLGEIIFPSVSGKTRTSFQLFLLDSSEITKSLYFLPFAKSSKKGKVTSFVKPPRMDTDSIHKETFIYS